MKRVHKIKGELYSEDSDAVGQRSCMALSRPSARREKVAPSRVYSGSIVVMNDIIARYVKCL
jgi:hypothetical protein